MVEKTDVLPPTRLIAGKYRLGRLLGEGGMGAVYEAEHTGLGARVAVKLLTERFAEDDDALRRFRREARASAAVRHENVVRVTDTGTDDDGVPFLVMELLDGESLNAILKRTRRLEPETAVAVIAQVLEGLSAAHDNGVIHRDLKPGNVFLAYESDGSQRAKILDFGISKFGDDVLTREITTEGAVVGTPQYMPPEQVAGTKDLDARADVYAVGVLLYRMLTGRLPFTADSPQKLYEEILRGKPTPPRELRPNLPTALEQTVMRAMAANRDHRFSDALEFKQALLDSIPSAPSRIPTLTPSPSGLSEPPRDDPSSAPTVPAARESDAGPAAPSAYGATADIAAARPRPWLVAAVVVPVFLVGVGATMWALGAGDQPPPKSKTDDPADPAEGEQAQPDEAAAAAAAGEPEQEPLRFGVTRYAPREMVVRHHQGFVDYLSERLEQPVELEVVDASLGLADRLVAGEVQLAALSAYKYVRAKQQDPDIKLLARAVRHGGATYQGLIVTRSDSSINSLGDLRGKVFCYVNESSTSGYLYPRAVLRRNGLDPDSAFRATRLTGDHLASLRNVYKGNCDAAAIYSNMLTIDALEHGMRPDEFHTVASTGRIPYDGYCAPSDQSAELSRKLREALLSLKPRSELAERVLGPASVLTGFREAAADDYERVRAIIEQQQEHGP